MNVTLLGTGSALPSPKRVQTGVLLDADDRRLLVDCGSGVLHRLAQADVPVESIDTVLLTHHHLDHVADVPSLAKAKLIEGYGSLTVVGPAGTDAVLGSLFAVDDLDERVELAVREIDAGSHRCAGFDIDAMAVRHSKRCFAYRFGDRLALSGDTEPFEALADFVDGVDALVHECSHPDGIETPGHTTPSALAESLAGCDVDRLYLTHLFPDAERRAAEIRDTVADSLDCDVFVGEDLRSIDC